MISKHSTHISPKQEKSLLKIRVENHKSSHGRESKKKRNNKLLMKRLTQRRIMQLMAIIILNKMKKLIFSVLFLKMLCFPLSMVLCSNSVLSPPNLVNIPNSLFWIVKLVMNVRLISYTLLQSMVNSLNLLLNSVKRSCTSSILGKRMFPSCLFLRI